MGSVKGNSSITRLPNGTWSLAQQQPPPLGPGSSPQLSGSGNSLSVPCSAARPPQLWGEPDSRQQKLKEAIEVQRMLQQQLNEQLEVRSRRQLWACITRQARFRKTALPVVCLLCKLIECASVVLLRQRSPRLPHVSPTRYVVAASRDIKLVDKIKLVANVFPEAILLVDAQAQRQLHESLDSHARYIHSLVQPDWSAPLPLSSSDQVAAASTQTLGGLQPGKDFPTASLEPPQGSDSNWSSVSYLSVSHSSLEGGSITLFVTH